MKHFLHLLDVPGASARRGLTRPKGEGVPEEGRPRPLPCPSGGTAAPQTLSLPDC